MRIETILLLAGGVAAAWWVFGKGVLPDLVGAPVQVPATATPGIQPAPQTAPGGSFFPGVPSVSNMPVQGLNCTLDCSGGIPGVSCAQVLNGVIRDGVCKPPTVN